MNSNRDLRNTDFAKDGLLPYKSQSSQLYRSHSYTYRALRPIVMNLSTPVTSPYRVSNKRVVSPGRRASSDYCE